METFKILQQRANTAKRNLKEDLRRLTAIFIRRGTKLTKIMNKSSENAALIIQKLIDIYGISDKVPKRTTDMTAARMLGLCPHYIARSLSSPDLPKDCFTAHPLPGNL